MYSGPPCCCLANFFKEPELFGTEKNFLLNDCQCYELPQNILVYYLVFLSSHTSNVMPFCLTTGKAQKMLPSLSGRCQSSLLSTNTIVTPFCILLMSVPHCERKQTKTGTREGCAISAAFFTLTIGIWEDSK